MRLLFAYHRRNQRPILWFARCIVTPQNASHLLLSGHPSHFIRYLILSARLPRELDSHALLPPDRVDPIHYVCQRFVARVPFLRHELDNELTIHADLHKITPVLPPLSHHKFQRFKNSKHLRLIRRIPTVILANPNQLFPTDIVNNKPNSTHCTNKSTIAPNQQWSTLVLLYLFGPCMRLEWNAALIRIHLLVSSQQQCIPHPKLLYMSERNIWVRADFSGSSRQVSANSLRFHEVLQARNQRTHLNSWAKLQQALELPKAVDHRAKHPLSWIPVLS